jgi:type II secretory pathway pseudopilin PulG
VTLLELIAVLAALLVLGAALLPSLAGLSRDTNVKAGADLLRQRMAEARSHAMADGRVYRVAVSPDGGTVRVSPDMESQADPDADAPFFAEDAFPKGVTARVAADPESPSASDSSGWSVVATVLPDGTCREDGPEVVVSEPNCYPITVQIRGLTGATTVTAGTQ